MTDWRSLMDKDFVGHWDLEPGKDIIFTITKVVKENLPDPATHKPGKGKPVISFEETTKKFVSNVTNCRAIASLYSNDTKKWVGRKISLYRTTTAVGGKATDCIRVRPQAPESK